MNGDKSNLREPTVLALLPDLPVAREWAKASAVAGDVLAAVRHQPHRRERSDGPSFPEPDLEISNIQLRPKRIFWRANRRLHSVALVRVLDNLEDLGHRVDLIHAHFSAASPGLPAAAAKRRIPYVVSEHSSAFTRFNPEKEIGKAGLKIAQKVFADAAAVLPVSKYLESEIRLRGLSGHFVVVPNPVDTELFRLRPESEPRTASVVTVARLAPVKGLDLLIKAIGVLSKTEPEVALDVIGDGSESEALRRLSMRLAITDRVRFHGQLDRREVARQLPQSSVFAMTSFTENMPVAMLEALACGLPVVAPESKWFGEVIDKVPGQPYQPGSVKSLVDALSRWLRPTRSQTRSAREVAVDHYSIEAVGKKLARVYGQALSG